MTCHQREQPCPSFKLEPVVNADGTTDFARGDSDDGRPVRQVLLAYLVAVLVPLAGVLAGVLVLSRSGQWVRRQGALIIALSVILMALGFGVGSMLVESYFAAEAQHELNAISSDTQRMDSESQRQLQERLANVRKEGAATDARLRALQEREGTQTGRR